MGLLNLSILVIVSAIGIACWWRFAVDPRTRLQPLLANPSTPARWGLMDVFIFAGLWLMAQGLSSVLFAGSVTPLAILTSFLLQTVLVLGTFGVIHVRYHYRWQDLWTSKIGVGNFPAREIGIGAIAFAMWAPVVWGIQSILVTFMDYDHQTFRAIREEPTFSVFVPTWLSAVVLAPVVEEVMFRGILQGWLQRFSPSSDSTPPQILLGDRPGQSQPREQKQSPSQWHPASIVLTSLLFGLAHASQGPAPVSLFVFSLGLGFVYQRTGSLLSCIVMHMLLNLFAMSLFTLEIFIAPS